MEHDHNKRRYDDIMDRPETSGGMGDSNFDDDAEIEAAAAMSETPMPIVLNSPTTAPSLIRPNMGMSQSSAPPYKPLHVQVNGFPNVSNQPRKSVDFPNTPSTFSPRSIKMAKTIVTTPLPSTRMHRELAAVRAGTSFGQMNAGPSSSKSNYGPSESSTLMGPPSSSSSVMLSPAGTLYSNGNRGSIGITSPLVGGPMSSPSTSSPSVMYSKHPLSQPPHRLIAAGQNPATAPAYTPQASQGGSSANNASYAGGRREHEITRRRVFGEKIHKLREEDSFKPFIPQLETQTDTQIAMMMRRFEKQGHMRRLPAAVQREVFEEKMDDAEAKNERVMRLIRSSLVLRTRDTDADEETDLSDIEPIDDERIEMRKDKTARKVPLAKVKWRQEKIRLGYQAARADFWMDEKRASLRNLEAQLEIMNQSSGCRFEGFDKEVLPRKRRRKNGVLELFDSSPFRRVPAEEVEGCARERPLMSWTRRKWFRDVFRTSRDSDDTQHSAGSSNMESSSTEDWTLGNGVIVARSKVKTHLTNGEPPRETDELDIETEHDRDQGYVVISNSDAFPIADVATTNEYRSFEQRALAYIHRLSCVPSLCMRRQYDRPVYMDDGEEEKKRVGARKELVMPGEKKKMDKKGGPSKNADMDEDGMLMDDEDWSAPAPTKSSTSRRGKKHGGARRGRGRPARTTKPRLVTNTVRRPQYGVDDFFLDDTLVIPMLPKMTYAHIHCPTWENITDDYWTKEPSRFSGSPAPSATTTTPLEDVPTSSGSTASEAVVAVAAENQNQTQISENPEPEASTSSSGTGTTSTSSSSTPRYQQTSDAPESWESPATNKKSMRKMSSKEAAANAEPEDELWMAVARNHHALTFLERERVKRDMAKKNRHTNSKMSAMHKSKPTSSSKPSTSNADGNRGSVDMDLSLLVKSDEEELLRDLPPFDLEGIIGRKADQSVRRFTSSVRPFHKRDFLHESGKR